MEGRSGKGIGIALSILSFIIGLGGIAMLIGVGEASNNTVTAFAVVSLIFALLAGFFAWLAPHASLVILICMSLPIAILGVSSAWSSRWMLPGAIWTVVLTLVGASLGAWLRSRKSDRQTPPPVDPPAS